MICLICRGKPPREPDTYLCQPCYDEMLQANADKRKQWELEMRGKCPSCYRRDEFHGIEQYVCDETTDTWLIRHRCQACRAWICRDALAEPAHASASGAH